MTVTLSIEITSPLTPDDRDLLSGIAVMTLAIANRELAQQGFPETFPSDADQTTIEQQGFENPCGAMDESGCICVSPLGHPEPHRFLTIAELS